MEWNFEIRLESSCQPLASQIHGSQHTRYPVTNFIEANEATSMQTPLALFKNTRPDRP
jgi:hypothetical protein